MQGLKKPLAGGGDHSLFISSTTHQDGYVWSCGRNVEGELGVGNTMESNIVRKINQPKNVISVNAGVNFSIFLDIDGNVWRCGKNDSLGFVPKKKKKNFIPTKVPGLSHIVQVSCAFSHALFLDSTGFVWGSGSNEYGQRGSPNTQLRQLAMIEAEGFPRIQYISAGFFQSGFIDDSGCVWTCGRNHVGQLGLGDQESRFVPHRLPDIGIIVKIAYGGSTFLLLDENGKVFGCGSNDSGQLILPNGERNFFTTLVELVNLPPIESIAAGDSHSLFLTVEGTVFACGYNPFGQTGQPVEVENQLARIENIPPIAEIECGYFHSILMTKSGEILTFGANANGQLGLGPGPANHRPRRIEVLLGSPPPKRPRVIPMKSARTGENQNLP